MTRAFDQLWAETYRYAAEHSPYYRALFRGASGVPPLASVPTVDKHTVSERNLDFLCVPRARVVEIVTTSGTTGKPLLWMLTEADVHRLAVNERLSFACAGLTAGDTVLVAVAMDRCFMAGLAYWLGLRELGCGIVRVGASSPTLVLEMIERVQPTVIVAVPSFLRVIADKARETGFDLRNCTVKKAVCIGEPIRDRDLTLNASGRAIKSAWDARVYSTYGVTELANSLCECDAGAGGHLHAEQLHLEILDDLGQPVADGEVGEVVATTFGVEGMPLIRYRTGDCAALFRAPCKCGRTSPRLGPSWGGRTRS
ncbi:MAG: AMP-binding protein [Verrucomicrobiota bacterium]